MLSFVEGSVVNASHIFVHILRWDIIEIQHHI